MKLGVLLSIITCAACVAAQTHGSGLSGVTDLSLAPVEARDLHADLEERSVEGDKELQKRASSRTTAARRKAAARQAQAVARAKVVAARRAAAAKKAAAARAASQRHRGSSGSHRSPPPARHHSPAPPPRHRTPAPAPAKHRTPAPAPAKAPASGNSLLTATHTGDATFFSVGLGACGWTNSDSDNIVAVSHILYDEFPGATANPNNNPICGRKVQTTYKGVTQIMTVVDKCMGCAEFDLDFSPSAFVKMAPESAGRLPGMTWHFL